MGSVHLYAAFYIPFINLLRIPVILIRIHPEDEYVFTNEKEIKKIENYKILLIFRQYNYS